MVILLVCFEMLRKIADSLRQNSDLHLGRPRVTVVNLIILDDRLLLFNCDGQYITSNAVMRLRLNGI